MPAIQFEDVRFTYPGAEAPALDGISFAVEPGEYVAVVGPNGCGKSTLALHMNALLRPVSGTVKLAGEDGTLTLDTANKKQALEVRRRCSMVFQDPDDQTVASTVEEDVAFGPGNLGLSPAEIRERVDNALKRVGLDGYQQRLVFELSRGQRQRVAVAGALAMEPDILVCDEPTAMLDASGRRAVMKVLRDVNQSGTAVVLITHDMEEALQASRIMVMSEGAILMDAAPRQVFSRENALRLRELGLELPAPAAYALDNDLPGDLPLTIEELADRLRG